MNKKLEDYLLSTLPANDEWITKMEKQAAEERIPIMDKLSINLLLQMIQMMRPKKILEIGTAIGYSVLRMHSVHPSSHITTIERESNRYEQAIQNIQDQNKQNMIHVINGDGLVELQKFALNDDKFDFIFIDAAKSQYKRFFELSNPLLNEGGVILSDNVLFKGYVAKLPEQKNRYSKMAQKMNDYNKWLVNHPDYITTIIPIGDGVAISYKKSKK